MPQVSKHTNLIIHQHRVDSEERSHWKPRLGGGVIGRGAWCDHYTTSLCNYQCIWMIHITFCTLHVVAREVIKSQYIVYLYLHLHTYVHALYMHCIPVCHHVSTTVHFPPPTTLLYQSQASSFRGSPTIKREQGINYLILLLRNQRLQTR